MRSPNFFVPGVIGVVLQIATTFATAMSLVRERERGTLEQLLVSPLSRWGLMLGKLTPYLVHRHGDGVGFVCDHALALCMCRSRAASSRCLCASLGLRVCTVEPGIADFDARAKPNAGVADEHDLDHAFRILFRIYFSARNHALDFLCRRPVLPTTYFIELMRAIILRGASLMEFWQHLAILSVMGLGLFGVCALRFKQKLA